jgi:hypothetical protein
MSRSVMVGCPPALRQSFSSPHSGTKAIIRDIKLVIFQRVDGFASILGTWNPQRYCRQFLSARP